MWQTDWPEPGSGAAAMDKLHHDLQSDLAKLRTATDDDFGSGYARFVAQAERSFATEEKWMEAMAFPGIKRHREEHARVLGALHNVHSHVMSGDLAPGKKVVHELLPQWLALHASTMDTVLAITMLMEGNLSSRPEATATQSRPPHLSGGTFDRNLPG